MLIADILPKPLPEGVFGYSRQTLLQALSKRGWEATTVPDEYRNAQAPEFSIDLDLQGYEGGGPFVVFKRNRKLGRFKYPPYASHLMVLHR